jgi:hypothetical protein
MDLQYIQDQSSGTQYGTESERERERENFRLIISECVRAEGKLY